MTTQNLLVELLVEELPPKALKKLGLAFASVLADSLKAQGLAGADAAVTDFASPRRLAVHVSGVSAQAADKAVSQKLMPVAVGLDATGAATPALLKKLQALGADASAVAGLKRAMDGKAEALFFESTVRGATLAEGLQKALSDAIAKLPIPKVMGYQLERDCELPGWTTVSFVRPAHGLVALHGSAVVPVTALGLRAGNATQGHRFEAALAHVVFAHADDYAANVSLFLQPDADADSLRTDLLARHPGLAIYTNASLRSEILRIFRQTFSITYALEVIGVAVAVIGLALTLISVLLDRREELTTLRALGFSRREIALATAIEGTSLAASAVAGGLVLSLALGWLLIHVINKQSFGWTLGFSLPWAQLAALAVTVVATGAAVSYTVGRWGADLPADREE